jgi:hypothetical protein
MDRRAATRTKKRLTCALVIDGSRVSGIVLDLSASGLFVQTSANPPPGAELGLELEIPGEAGRSILAVRVARKKVVPPRLKSVVQGGLGLQIERAPEAYFGYVAQLQSGEVEPASPAAEAAAAPTAQAKPADPRAARRDAAARLRARARRAAAPRPPAAAKQQRFRVRVSQIQGSRSRSVEVLAGSEEEARCEAMASVGEGWKILDCECLA